MDLEQLIKSELKAAISDLFGHELADSEATLLPTRKEFEGDYTFVTFPLLKISKKNPEETGRLIGERLLGNSRILGSFNVVKGFLNLTIREGIWLQIFAEAYSNKNYGQLPPKHIKVIIEYSSPNTNKPLHLGHMRNIFLGYAVAQIQKAAGYDIEKVNLINDRGIHICKSMLAYSKFGNGESPESSGIKGDHLIGKYYVLFDKEYKKQVQELVEKGLPKETADKEAPMLKEAQAMLIAWEEGNEEVVALWRKMNQWVYDGFEVTYRRMGVDFDKMYYESDTYLLGKAIVDEGLQKGIFYSRADGSVWADLREDGLDEKLLLRSDGTSVYITQDLGTADLKYTDYAYDKSVYVVGNEQDYHFEVLFKLLKKLNRPYAGGLFHLSYGMVDLPSGRMKSREGTVVDADDMMDEMAATARQYTSDLGKIDDFDGKQAEVLYETLAMGALKYFLLKVDPKKRMMFNPEESIQFHGNTGPFIQYTYARISAVKRKADELGIKYDDFNIASINGYHPSMKPVFFLLNNYHNLIEESAEQYSPSVIAQFVYDLAKEYNRFYTEETILKETDENYLKLKVAYSVFIAKVIKQSMGLLGINVPERM
ncbi:MAG: arginine--tRNA ligase [Cyclobacteriaceae bacterium]|nr:arginine--tRNA ligase [Cyclobacteriaceae bacterium]